MSFEQFPFLVAGVLIIAFLYSSVGHAGASGYIAMMALFSLSPSLIKPTALILNILVASIGSWQYWRAHHFSWSLFWPFAALSVPFASVGGYINLPDHLFKVIVGAVLLFSAARFLLAPQSDQVANAPSHPIAISVGAGLGLLAGLTGTGGGIFLTPLLLFMRWSRAKTAAAVSALFILLNSVAGLFGNLTSTSQLPLPALALAVAAVAGGTAGSHFGSRRFSPTTIKRFLAIVLVIAGTKLIFTR